MRPRRVAGVVCPATTPLVAQEHAGQLRRAGAHPVLAPPPALGVTRPPLTRLFGEQAWG